MPTTARRRSGCVGFEAHPFDVDDGRARFYARIDLGPRTIVSDNGTKLTSNAVLLWSSEVGIDWHYIAPGGAAQGTSGTADGMAAEGSRPKTALSKASTAGSNSSRICRSVSFIAWAR